MTPREKELASAVLRDTVLALDDNNFRRLKDLYPLHAQNAALPSITSEISSD